MEKYIEMGICRTHNVYIYIYVYIYIHMCIDRLISSRLSFPCCAGNGLILPPDILICLAEDCNFAANGHENRDSIVFFPPFFKLCGDR